MELHVTKHLGLLFGFFVIRQLSRIQLSFHPVNQILSDIRGFTRQ